MRVCWKKGLNLNRENGPLNPERLSLCNSSFSRNQKWRVLLAWVSNPCWGLFQISSHGTVQPSYRAANTIIQLSWCLGCSIGMPPWMVFTFGEKTTWDDLRCIKPKNPVNHQTYSTYQPVKTRISDVFHKEYMICTWRGGVEIMQCVTKAGGPGELTHRWLWSP